MTVFVVNSCGPRTSLQDVGRSGFQRYGVASSGAMDGFALAAANILVGNAPGTAAIELMLVGGSFGIEDGTTRVAVAGAPCAVTLEGRPVAPSTAVAIEPGQTLTIGSMQAGVYAYLAVGGGFDWPSDLGSHSLHQRAALGGFHGRAFRAGDRIPLGPSGPADAPVLSLPAAALDGDAPVRVVLGPQDDYFSEAGVATFLSSTYRVSQEADRMGYRLTGPRIEHSIGFNIVSDGIVAGSVQVPGSGEPIVMMADRQTTGGYPKIATVISADLRVVAQRRPGDGLRFEVVGVEEAQQIARERVAQLRALAALARPVRGGLPPPEELLGLNLAGAAVDALARDS